jgi:hypothetical protein
MLDKRTNFGEMVDVCGKAKIFTESECNKIKKLIKSRNQIHLHTLTTVGTGVSEKELEEKFEIVRMATNQIETQFT